MPRKPALLMKPTWLGCSFHSPTSAASTKLMRPTSMASNIHPRPLAKRRRRWKRPRGRASRRPVILTPVLVMRRICTLPAAEGNNPFAAALCLAALRALRPRTCARSSSIEHVYDVLLLLGLLVAGVNSLFLQHVAERHGLVVGQDH